jgi:uncharacterized membrane protein YfhO
MPVTEFDKKISVPSSYSKLKFSIGLDPITCEANRGGGAHFQINLIENGKQTILFSKHINPSNNPCKWVHQDHDVVIYENKEVFRLAFMVYNVLTVSNFDQALDALDNPSLDLRQVAVVENLPNNVSNSINENTEKMPKVLGTTSRINSGKVKIVVETKYPVMLVLAEQYYSGWHAYVDDKETPIYPVDGILREVFLNEGKHSVIFEYKPLSFSIGLMISMASLLVVVVSLVYLYRQSPHGIVSPRD